MTMHVFSMHKREVKDMKKLYIVVFALMVLLSMAMSGTALQSKTITRQSGMSANAAWSEKTADGGYIDKYLSVTETKDGTDIYVSICISDATGNYSCKSGYNFTQENLFDMDSKRLDSATLTSVQVDLFDWFNPTPVVETITIKADWTGIGDVIKGSYKSISKYNDFISKYSDSSSYRGATATGSINDQDLGTSSYGSLVKFKSATMWMQK